MAFKRNRLSDEGELIMSTFFPTLIEQAALVLLISLFQMAVSKADNNLIATMSLIDQVYLFSSSVLVCVSTGCAILTAQYFGAGNVRGIKRLVKASFITGAIISTVIMVLFVLFPRQILLLAYPSLQGELLNQSSIYLRYAGFALPFYFAFTNATGILRACLNTRAALFSALVSSLVNMSVSLVLIYGFDFGVSGVGIGLLVSRIVSSAVASILTKRQLEVIQVGAGNTTENLPIYYYVKQIVKLGGFVLIEHIVFNTGKLVLQGKMIEAGDAHVTANAIATTLLNMFTIPGTSMTIITQNIAGKYKGEGKENRIYIFTKKQTLITAALLAFVVLVTVPLMRQIIGFFTDNAEVSDLTYKIIMIAAFLLPTAWAIASVPPSVLRGTGDTRFPAIIISISMWVYRIPLNGILMSKFNLGAVSVWVTMCSEWLLYSIIFFIYINYKKKRLSSPMKSQKTVLYTNK